MKSPTRAALAALTLLSLLAASARAERPREAVGLYPVEPPEGHEAVLARLSSGLHDGAAALPGVRVFDLIAKGACAPDEGACLAEAARGANLDSVVSAQVSATDTGYRYHVRAFAARGGALRGEERGEVKGGPLDLASALDHGVCAALSRGPCEGSLWVGLVPGDGADGRLLVDGVDHGLLPLSQPLALPIGRHRVQAGSAEARVQIGYGRAVRLVATARDGAPALVDEGELSAPARAAASAPAESVAPPAQGLSLEAAPDHALIARVLMGSGMALLASGAGLGLYSLANPAHAQASTTSGGATALGQGRAAGTAALLFAATGVGALTAGGILLVAAPDGVAAVGHF